MGGSLCLDGTEDSQTSDPHFGRMFTHNYIIVRGEGHHLEYLGIEQRGEDSEGGGSLQYKNKYIVWGEGHNLAVYRVPWD